MNTNDIDEAIDQMEASNETLQYKVDQLVGQFDNIIDGAEKALPETLVELEVMNQQMLNDNEIDLARTQARAEFELDSEE